MTKRGTYVGDVIDAECARHIGLVDSTARDLGDEDARSVESIVDAEA